MCALKGIDFGRVKLPAVLLYRLQRLLVCMYSSHGCLCLYLYCIIIAQHNARGL